MTEDEKNMKKVFIKMQYKGDEEIVVLSHPDEFKNHIEEISSSAQIYFDYKKIKSDKKFGFILIFVKSCAEVEKFAQLIKNNLTDDGNFWFAYPKKTSKKYTADISRDNGWQPLGDLGFEAVRGIAIDDDWSALRFRLVRNIRNLKRDKSRIMSNEGRTKK